MPIVTLTSDWNSDDYYSAAVKGTIISRCPGTCVVDITNQIPSFNIALAAFQVKHTYSHFPPETIHIIAVNNASEEKSTFIALRANNHYFIGYDNGIFGLILDSDPEEIVSIELSEAGTFPEQSAFAMIACEIIKTGKLSGLGKPHQELYKQVLMLPAIDESVINGSVVYIDSYKNAITNITRELFDQIGKGRSFDIFVQSNHNRIVRLCSKYSDSSLGEMLALFNSLNLLEIAINGGNAAELLNLTLNSSVRIKFKDNK